MLDGDLTLEEFEAWLYGDSEEEKETSDDEVKKES